MARSTALVRCDGVAQVGVYTFAVHEGFETGGALVVEHLKYGAEATVNEMGVQGGIDP